MKKLTLIGRAERISFPDLGFQDVPAKIDTGADYSSIWASATLAEDESLEVIFFGPESVHYDGVVHRFPREDYYTTRVSNSFGHKEERYKVRIKARVNGRLINGRFTLSDRSTKLYPILLGRSILNGKFLVDVSAGEPLIDEERSRAVELKEYLSETKGAL